MLDLLRSHGKISQYSYVKQLRQRPKPASSGSNITVNTLQTQFGNIPYEHTGNSFHNISGSTIVSRSFVEHSFNRIRD